VLPEKSVDILLEIAVFEHISEDATKAISGHLEGC
jgi:hypothetical protein